MLGYDAGKTVLNTGSTDSGKLDYAQKATVDTDTVFMY